MQRSLFKYFQEHQHAEDFLAGTLLFRSLAYFRDHEDAARGDEYEGTNVFLPESGLQLHNETEGTDFTLPMAFESSVKASEIFVYCVSRTYSATLAAQFGAVACIEITRIATFCSRIEAALPATATFTARKVDYYPSSQCGNPRWALLIHIATSKLHHWADQDEYRFVFSVTDALGFENVALRLVERRNRPAPKLYEHLKYFVQTRSLNDICVLRDT